jgi:hypothetical protein
MIIIKIHYHYRLHVGPDVTRTRRWTKPLMDWESWALDRILYTLPLPSGGAGARSAIGATNPPPPTSLATATQQPLQTKNQMLENVWPTTKFRKAVFSSRDSNERRERQRSKAKKSDFPEFCLSAYEGRDNSSPTGAWAASPRLVGLASWSAAGGGGGFSVELKGKPILRKLYE